MSRRSRLFALGIIPPLLTLLAFGALVPAGTQAQPADPADSVSDCEMSLLKTVTPDRMLLGESATVTMVVDQQCPDYGVPIDLVFLVDTSNSMTRGTPGGGGGSVDPGEPIPGPVPPDPGPGPGDPPRPAPLSAIGAQMSWRLVDALGVPLQDPPAPIPPPEPPGPGEPGEPAPGVPSPGNPNEDPPGCVDNDAVGPGGGSVDPPPGGPGPVVPPPAPAPGTSVPRRTEPVRTPIATPPDRPTEAPGRPTDAVSPGESGEPAGNADLIRDAQKFIRDFFDEEMIQDDLDNGRLRVGLVDFNDRARRLVSLTEKGTRVVSRLSLLRGGGRTRVDLGLAMAERVLTDTSSYRTALKDKNRQKVIILISDGAFCERDMRRRVGDEIEIVTLAAGRGIYTRRMRDIATESEYVLDLNARAIAEVMDLYDRVFRDVRPVSITRLEVREKPNPIVGYVPGSEAPAVTGMDGTTMRWNYAPPASVFTHTYQIRPTAVGTHRVSEISEFDWLDTEGRTNVLDFPAVDVLVYEVEPTPTDLPTATPVPTATATDVPPTPTEVVLRPAYFPLALKDPEPPKCTPQQQKVDIVMIIDTSTSMNETTSPGGPRKIEAAINAAKSLADLLTLPASGDQDQAAVVSFNDAATLLLGMSTDRDAIKAALDRLATMTDEGTRIDRGLQEGLTEMRAAGRAGTTKTIILVTDGRQTEVGGGAAAVLATADDIKDEGIVLFTVGLGTDVDEALLRSAATDPGHYKAAPDAAILELIYSEIAREIPCKTD